MPTRKIVDRPTPKRCSHHDHDPPNMMVFEPGVYEHECPACGKKVTFVVRNTTMSEQGKDWDEKCWTPSFSRD